IFGRFYFVGRLIQVLCGVLLLIAMVWAVGTAFNTNAAALSALLLAVNPTFVSTSQFSQASMPVTFLSFMSVAFLLRGLNRKIPKDSDFLWACFFCGFAIGTKLSALAFLAALAFYAFQCRLS